MFHDSDLKFTYPSKKLDRWKLYAGSKLSTKKHPSCYVFSYSFTSPYLGPQKSTISNTFELILNIILKILSYTEWLLLISVVIK